MRVLVTGGAGFIGSAVCRCLIARGCVVINADKLTYAANVASLDTVVRNSSYIFYKVDICDRAAMERIFTREQPDAVIHLAAESHVDRSITEPASFITTNIVGTYQLLEVARSYWDGLPASAKNRFRFLHISTDEVFGSLDDTGVFEETTAYDPNSPYSASKAASDHLALAWHRTYGLPVLVSTCCNNYGPYQFPEKLIPLTITNALLGRTLPVYGDGQNVRDWIFVDDHAAALYAILRRGEPGERYNVGARAELSNIAVVTEICDYLDEIAPRDGGAHRDAIRLVADRPGHDFRYAIRPDKIEQQLGWRSRETFQSGLRKTVDWYIGNEPWWRTIRETSYDGEQLGLIVLRRYPDEAGEHVPHQA